MKIDKNFMTTYAKVATHDGESEAIQIWAKDNDAYTGIGTDKLGIWERSLELTSISVLLMAPALTPAQLMFLNG